MVGYPSDDVPLDTATKFFNCLPLSLTTSEAPAPTVGADQMRPEFQLLLRMNQDELSNEHGPEKGPNPLGASGGAVFSLGEGWKNGGPSSLVGLATVWWHGDHAFLVTDLRRWINFYRTEKAKNFAAGDADATI